MHKWWWCWFFLSRLYLYFAVQRKFFLLLRVVLSMLGRETIKITDPKDIRTIKIQQNKQNQNKFNLFFRGKTQQHTKKTLIVTLQMTEKRTNWKRVNGIKKSATGKKIERISRWCCWRKIKLLENCILCTNKETIQGKRTTANEKSQHDSQPKHQCYSK